MQSFKQYQGANYVGVQYQTICHGWLAQVTISKFILRLATPVLRVLLLDTSI